MIKIIPSFKLHEPVITWDSYKYGMQGKVLWGLFPIFAASFAMIHLDGTEVLVQMTLLLPHVNSICLTMLSIRL